MLALRGALLYKWCLLLVTGYKYEHVVGDATFGHRPKAREPRRKEKEAKRKPT